MLPSIFLKHKMQGSRSIFSVSEWLEAVIVSMSNLLVFSWTAALPLWYLHTTFSRIPMESDDFIWYHELAKFPFLVIIVDLWFYWTHRLLHVPPLYVWIHKFHHRFKAPTSVASMYANPIEFVLGNLIGVQLGPMIMSTHPYTAYFWVRCPPSLPSFPFHTLLTPASILQGCLCAVSNRRRPQWLWNVWGVVAWCPPRVFQV